MSFVCQMVQLRHLESLYETIEGMVSYFVLQNVDAAFRKKVPQKIIDDEGS